MAIRDLFSKRQSDAAKAGQEDVYQYLKIPSNLRVQVQQIAIEALGLLGSAPSMYGTAARDNPAWLEIEKSFKREKGLNAIDIGEYAGQRVLKYMGDCTTPDWLDLFELVCATILVTDGGEFNQHRHDWSVAVSATDAIDEINQRLRRAGVGYQMAGAELVKVSSQFVHAEIVVPALQILQAHKFTAANDEYRKAHREFRAGSYQDCITDCGKAIESVLKVLAAERKWPGVGNTSQLSALIKAAADNGLFAGYMVEQINGIKALVQGAGTVRNKDGAHGQGTASTKADEDLAGYQLHQTASALIFIGNRAAAT